MEARNGRVRVAVITGTLEYGGSENQMLFLSRALRDLGIDVRIYSLARGVHESTLRRLNIPVSFIRPGPPFMRLVSVARRLMCFRPHFVQSTHAFANLYAALAARCVGAVGIGALRSDLEYCRQQNGKWTEWLMRLPAALVVNSRCAAEDILRSGWAQPGRIFHIPNAVELMDRADSTGLAHPTAAFVGRLVAAKRADRFLRGLAAARANVPALRGIVIGEGPERQALEALARSLGLLPDHVQFFGARGDAAQLLRAANFLVLTSDHEATPNAVLEAMAAGLPVIATPAGDAPCLVEDGLRGFVVPFENESVLADRMAKLAVQPALRQAMGGAAREWISKEHSVNRMQQVLVGMYANLAPEPLKPRFRQLLQCG